MQNVQNASEIQQRVINLVELYRTKVGKESEAAVKARQFVFSNPSLTITDFGPIDMFRVDEQLAGHFYSLLASENADERIPRALLPELPHYFDDTIFSQDDVTFLMAHFKEMVDYIIKTPSPLLLDEVQYTDNKTAFLIPDELLKLISERIKLSKGSIVYNPFAGYAQFACLFKNCKFYCEETYSANNVSTPYEYSKCNRMWGWMMVMLYANQIDSLVFRDGDGDLPVLYDAVMAFVPYIPTLSIKQGINSEKTEVWTETHPVIRQFYQSYKNLKKGGKMILICPCSVLCKREGYSYPLERFWEQLIKESSIKEIIQLPKIMSHHTFSDDYCLLIIEKESTLSTTTLIDARFAVEKYNCFSESDFVSMGESLANVPFCAINVDESLLFVRLDRDIFNFILNSNAFNCMIENEGIDCVSGLCKMKQIPSKELRPHLLLPVVYVTEKPSAIEHPVPMSSLCSFETSHIYDVQSDLPEDTPWVVSDNLSPTYTGPLSISSMRKAGLHNNPKGWKYGTQKLSPFSVGAEGSGITDKDIVISDYRNCYYLDGSKDAVLFKFTKDGLCTAIVRATGKAVAVDSTITVLYPSKEAELLSLFASINLPIVYRQIQVYIELEILNGHLNDILVPSKKLIIQDEKQRLLKEAEVYNQQEEKLAARKTEYINEVRMRKHDMRPHMKQLNSAKNLMLYYVDSIATVKDVQDHIRHQLIRFQNALGHLSDIIEHLSDEEEFGEPELFSLTEYFEKIVLENIRNGVNIIFEMDDDAVGRYFIKQINDFRDYMKTFADKKNKEISPFNYPFHNWSYVSISRLAFDRMVQNIIENARKHGFTDPNRKDYMIRINISIDEEHDMYQIDFMNNGTPLPEGMTKERYGIKGEKAGLSGGTGSGGYIVKSIVTHYGGDYDVFYNEENQLTTVRIYLPIATI